MFFAEVHRNLPRVVAGRKTRLIRTVVFLVDDDESQIADGSKYGAAHSDDNPRLAPRNTPPFRKPLAAGQSRMEHRAAVAETLFNGFRNLMTQRDFGNQIDNRFSGNKRTRGGL